MKSIRMPTSAIVVSCLTRITQGRDGLGAIGEKVDGSELVWTTLNGVTKPWTVFVEAIVSRENMPSWDSLWDDFI